MGLRDIESTLPPGFRFYPSDEELVCHYLYKKVASERASQGTMVEVDLHTCEPWELPVVAKLGANEWYFFSFRDRKYATGLRTNRATKSGYWKATGKDRTIYRPSTRFITGMRKTLVFYQGRAPNGVKTGWVMHEFRLETPDSRPKEDWVLCRVFHKRKGEAMRYSLDKHEQQDHTTGCPSPDLEPSPPMPAGSQAMQQGLLYGDNVMGLSFMTTAPHQEDHSSGSSLLNMAALFPCSNFLDLPDDQELDSSAILGLSSSGVGNDEDYDFLLKGGFGDHHFGEKGMVENLGGMLQDSEDKDIL